MGNAMAQVTKLEILFFEDKDPFIVYYDIFRYFILDINLPR